MGQGLADDPALDACGAAVSHAHSSSAATRWPATTQPSAVQQRLQVAALARFFDRLLQQGRARACASDARRGQRSLRAVSPGMRANIIAPSSSTIVPSAGRSCSPPASPSERKASPMRASPRLRATHGGDAEQAAAQRGDRAVHDHDASRRLRRGACNCTVALGVVTSWARAWPPPPTARTRAMQVSHGGAADPPGRASHP